MKIETIIAALLVTGCADAGPDPRFQPPGFGGGDDAGGSTGASPDAAESTGDADVDGDGDTTGDEAFDDLTEYVYGLGHLELADFVPKTETECEGLACPVDGPEGEEYCVYVDYEETVHADELIAFQPNSATLWPGNVVRGEDAQHGILTPIGLPRAPMTFSVSLENLQGSPVGEMDNPTLSAFRDERNRILDQGLNGAAPAQMTFDIQKVFSESQVAVAVGGKLSWFGSGFSTMFDFTNNFEATKILVDFSQSYYTIDVDTPGLPSDFFEEGVTVAQMENFAGPGDPPMYVQSITYGRRVLFAIESSHSEKEVNFALEASFGAFLGGASIEVETHHRDVLAQSHITALIFGGSGSDAALTVTGFDGLMQFLTDGADYSKESPGAAIAYKLAYLDNSGVKLALATEYSERQCYDTHVDVSGQLAKLEYLGGNDPGGVQVYGQLYFRIAPPGEADPCRANAPGWTAVFERSDDSAQDVYGVWVPPAAIVQTLFDIEIPPAEPLPSLCMRGDLREKDSGIGSGDDEFGVATLGPIPLDAGWPGDHPIEFANEGTVVATIRIAID
ncbi:MAG: thiol-activated cytolysin family protein [Myxococcota bacterium]